MSPIKVLQWNTLADQYSGAFPKVDQRFVQWPHRSERIRQTIAKANPDIIGLQEVDHYEDFFRPTLADMGYFGIYGPKSSGAYGCAVFYKQDKYQLVNSRIIDLVDQVAVIVELLAGTSTFIFATTHLKAKEEFEPVRVQQMQSLLAEIGKMNPRNQPVIIAGDLNTEPTGSVIPLLLDACYESAYPLDKGICTTVKYKETYCARMIDYIFAAGFMCTEYSPLPDPELFDDVGLPAEYVPSDHFCLSAVF